MASQDQIILAPTMAPYMNLDQGKNVQVMYVWIDGTGEGMRCKTRTVDFEPKLPSELPVWHYDGSSCGHADGGDSDVYLKPVAIFRDPFRGDPNKLVLCDTEYYDGRVTHTNKRRRCVDVMEKAKDHHPWFGIEQEYVLLDHSKPLCWPKHDYTFEPKCGIKIRKKTELDSPCELCKEYDGI